MRFFVNWLIDPSNKVLHPFSDEHLGQLLSDFQWHYLNNSLEVPDDGANVDFFLLRANSIVNSLDDVVGVECRQDEPEARIEALKETSVDVVGINLRNQIRGTIEPLRIIRALHLLSEGFDETIESEFACTVVRVTLAGHMASNRADVDEVIARVSAFVCLNTFLGLEEHHEVDVGVEVDVHGELHLADGELINALADASCCVVHKYVYFAVFRGHFGPKGFYVLLVGQISLVEVDAAEFAVT